MKKLRLKDYLRAHEHFHISRIVRRKEKQRRHTHDFAEVFWVENGRGTHIINDRMSKLFPGNIVMIRASDVHDFDIPVSEHLQIINLAFPTVVLVDLKRRYPDWFEMLWGETASLPHWQTLVPARINELTHAYSFLLEHRDNLFDLDRFLMNLASMLLTEASPIKKAVPQWLNSACEAITQPEHFVSGVPKFIHLAGKCQEHVCRMTQQLLHKTPSEIVNDARLQHAALKLLGTDRKIIDIAFDCGYESVAYFYKRFKEHHGETPQSYRIRHRALV